MRTLTGQRFLHSRPMINLLKGDTLMPPETIALAPIRTRRLPRFRRASHEEQPAFRLTDRDRELFKNYL